MEGITLANAEYECGKSRRLIIKLRIGEIQTTWSAHVFKMDDAPISPSKVRIYFVQAVTSLYRLNIDT